MIPKHQGEASVWAGLDIHIAIATRLIQHPLLPIHQHCALPVCCDLSDTKGHLRAQWGRTYDPVRHDLQKRPVPTQGSEEGPGSVPQILGQSMMAENGVIP